MALVAALFCVGWLIVQGTDARADGGRTWRYAPAAPPSPPPGGSPAPYPVPLGTVGQISFWAPNHGLLITGGTEPSGSVAAGLYAYDGVEWHQLSSVCGGAQGRIAWAGPDEFWTISDQRAGQLLGRQEGAILTSVSLCHFLDGKVVASYAMPLGQPGSYLQMDAAACVSPNDCWFAGKDGQGANVGSFHLHWDGSGVSAIYDPEDHAVTGVSKFEGRLYEGLAIGPEDSYLPGESQTHPKVIREVAAAGNEPECPAGEPPSGPFCNAFPVAGRTELPTYPNEAEPDVLGGFDVATDGTPGGEELGEFPTGLWAAADPVGGHAPVTVLHDTNEGSWTQVIPNSNGTPLEAGEYLAGSETDPLSSQATLAGNSLAPEPGTEAAWLSLRGGPGKEGSGKEGAYVARLQANGTIEREAVLPNPSLDPVGDRGEAGPIACVAAADCWMATNEGWLFHLGGAHERDDDPYFSQLITERPPDAGVPVIYPDSIEESANSEPTAGAEPPPRVEVITPKRAKAKPLVTHLKSKFLHGRTLRITFTLTARAHVQLIGRYRGRVVASTRRETLRPGKHEVSLTLNPARWPTRLQFAATPVNAPVVAPTTEGTGGPSAGGANPNNTVST